MGKKQVEKSLRRTLGWLFLTTVFCAGAPTALLVALGRRGLDFSGALVLVLLAVTALDALFLLVLGLATTRSIRLPRAPGSQYPPAGAIVLADRTSTPARVDDTVDSLLRMPYLSPVQIVVACGSSALARAAEDLILKHEASARAHVVEIDGGSPLMLFAAALSLLQVEFVGVFRPGQRPARGVFVQAWVWLSRGFDLLYGVVNADNAGESWTSRLAAVDLAGIDAPLSPLDSSAAGAGGRHGSVFLTAPLASSIVDRAGGPDPAYRTARDRLLTVWQDVPVGMRGNWGHWVAQETAALASNRALVIRGPGFLYRTVWRPALVWLTPAVFVAAGYRLAQAGPHPPPSVFGPVVALLVLYTLVPGILRSAFAYALAEAGLRSHRSWFAFYALAWTCWLGAARNSAVRVAQTRLALGRRPRHTPMKPAVDADLSGRPCSVDILPMPEPEPDQIAREAEALPQTPPLTTSADSQPAQLSPGAWRVVETASRLPEVIAIIVSAIDRVEEECKELQCRVRELERRAAEAEAIMSEIYRCGSNTIGLAALERLRRAVSDLDAHPEDVAVLAVLSQQAEPLARVVDSYAHLRGAALVE
jgi:hypothetical protein